MRNDISQLERSQVDKLSEIGARLREFREEQLLTLEQVAGKTMIQARLLNAIETGKLHQLPEPVYIQGFIKRYADALGLDGTELASAFPLNTDIRAVQPTWKDSPAAQLRPIHLYAAYVLLIVTAVSCLSYLMNGSTSWVTGRDKANQASSPVQEESATRRSPAASAESASQSPASDPASAKPVQVEMTLTAQSWMRVEVDGKTEFQGILPEGTQRTWTADTELKVRAGNAGGVMLAYNNGQAQRMGAPGAVEEVIFSADQQAASLSVTETASIRN